MLAMWGHVEADFRRDYGLRLCEELPRMSWREFQVLLNGLSPQGAVATHYDAVAKRERLRMERERPELATQAAGSFWTSVAAIGKPPG